MKKKIAAVIVAILVIVFPFRKAFLSSEEPGFMMMLSFLITLAGIFLFYYLTIQPRKHE
jgi:hypothetical protein